MFDAPELEEDEELFPEEFVVFVCVWQVLFDAPELEEDEELFPEEFVVFVCVWQVLFDTPADEIKLLE